MDELGLRFVQHMAARLDGPLHFRFVLQPAMSIVFAVRDGFRDARERRPAWLWTICTSREQRKDLLREGWKSIARVFILAMIMDAIYQFIEFRAFHPLEALITSMVLAMLPYAILRGPINRIARHWIRRAGVAKPAHQE